MENELIGLPLRKKLMLVGLYLSKFDTAALDSLGFDSFTEAFNAIGYALKSKPASIKNCRDEFDPPFPNPRLGWHKRAIRADRLQMFGHYRDLDFGSFTTLIKSFVGLTPAEESDPTQSTFAKRLITGLAAERYFESIHAKLSEFHGHTIENTILLGCGYDFRLTSPAAPRGFLAVEVKGLSEPSGTVSLTTREYETAATLKNRFFLFVATNFRQKPSHEIFRDPTAGNLQFHRTERSIVQVSWLVNV
jgi:hypothetical protein